MLNPPNRAGKPERKVYEIKSAALEDNVIKGGASVIGNVDLAGDVIFPGFYDAVLAKFLKDGFVADGHDWSKMIAMPLVARMEGNLLYTEAKFHSTADAQAVRTVCKERLENNLSVGLSVGFSMLAEGYKYFKNGQALLDYAKANGYDMVLFDEDDIRSYKGTLCALLKAHELYEYSTVSVPCNPQARAAEVKSLLFGDVRTKGEFLGSWIETSAILAALYEVMDTLTWRVYCLVAYADEEDAKAELLVTVAAMFEEGSSLCVKIIDALLDLPEADMSKAQAEIKRWATLQEEFKNAPVEEREPLTFTKQAAQLETTVAAFATLVSRRQETRAKSGRKLSAATCELLSGVCDGLNTHCETLKGMLAEADDSSTTDDTTDSDQVAEAKAALLMQAELLRLEIDTLLD